MTRKESNYLQKYISAKVRYHRKQQHISQEDLSEKASLGLKYINQLENKNNNVTITSLEKIIQALELTPQEFFDFSFNQESNEEETSLALRRLNMKIQQLPKDKFDTFIAIFEDILDNL